MTEEKLKIGWDLLDEILRRRKDLDVIAKNPVVSIHGCTRLPTENEKKLDERIKSFTLKVIGDELKRLEKEFAKI